MYRKLKLGAIVLALIIGSSCVPHNAYNLSDFHNRLLKKQYTQADITRIRQGFRTKPLQYSQQLGDFLMWQINNKNQTFTQQLAELPDLNDGINPNEVKVLRTIYDYIKDINFPKDFANQGKLKLAKVENYNGEFNKISALEEMTLDGLKHDRMRYSPSLEAFIWHIIDGKFNAATFENDYVESKLLYKYPPSKKESDRSFKAMMEGRYRVTIENIAKEDYKNSYYFTLRVWDDMEGYRWTNFGIVAKRLNDPYLLSYYINRKFKKSRGDEKPYINSPTVVFKEKHGFCTELAIFGNYILKLAGYNGKIYWDMSIPLRSGAPSGAVSGHTIATYENEDGLMHIFIDWRHWPRFPGYMEHVKGLNSMYKMDKGSFKKRYIFRNN